MLFSKEHEKQGHPCLRNLLRNRLFFHASISFCDKLVNRPKAQ